MLREPPGANEGNHIQAKFAMGERPASFLFGMISHVIPRAGGGGTLTHDHPQLPETLQGHHLPSAVIRYPQSLSACFTGLPKRCQRSGELCFGSRGSSRHRFAPVAKRPAVLPQRTPAVKEGFPFSGFFSTRKNAPNGHAAWPFSHHRHVSQLKHAGITERWSRQPGYVAQASRHRE